MSGSPLRVLPREISFAAPDPAVLGVKGARLVEMGVLKVRVPRFGVLTRAAFDAHLAQPEIQRVLEAARSADLSDQVGRVARGEALRRAIVTAKLPPQVQKAIDELRAGFSEEERFAVRPSPLGSLSLARSLGHAGSSELFVHGDDLPDLARAVFAQALSADALEVRFEAGEPLLEGANGVIIQRVVASEVSGEARSLDPGSVDPKVRIDVSFGLGGGRDEPDALRDRFTVERPEVAEGANVERATVESRLVDKRQALRRDEEKDRGTRWVAVDERQVPAPALTQMQARQVASEALKLEASFGRPVSLGFAFSGRLLHILDAHLERQSPARGPRQGKRRVFDARPLPASLRGATSPLTYSFARRAVELAAVDALLKLDVRRDDLRANRAALEHLVGYVGGHVMANVEAWRTVLSIIPRGERVAAAVGELLEVPDLLPDLGEVDNGGLAWVREVKAFRELFDSVRGECATLLDEASELPRPKDDDDEDTLLEQLDKLEQHVVRAVSLIALCGLSAAVLVKLSLDAVARAHPDAATSDATREARVGARPPEVDLPGLWLSLTAAARDHQVVREILTRDESEGALDRLEGREGLSSFQSALDALRAVIGDLPAGGWLLESPSPREDPRVILSRLRALLGVERPADDERRRAASEARQRAVLALEAALEKRRVFGVMSEVKRARGALDDASEARALKRSLESLVDRLAGAVRLTARALGKRLCGYDLLDREHDVFYLQVEELRGLIRGTSVITYARPIVAARKRSAQTRPVHVPVRVETAGAVFDLDLDEAAPDTSDEGFLEGASLVPGEGRGRVVHLDDARAGDALSDPFVLVATAPVPLDLPLLLHAKAVILTEATSLSGAVTELANAGIPTLRLARAGARLVAGEDVIVDADKGRVLRVADAAADDEVDRTDKRAFARLATPSQESNPVDEP